MDRGGTSPAAPFFLKHMVILFYILAIVILILDPYFDHKWWADKNREVNHKEHTFVAATAFFFLLSWWAWNNRVELYEYIAHVVLLIGLRWNIHDAVFNYLRRKPLDYVGDGINDSYTDKLLKRIPLNPFIIKMLFLALCIVVAILLYKYQWPDIFSREQITKTVYAPR